jgi:hypothetical protein
MTTLNADTLPLPKNLMHAIHIDGMREVIMEDIVNDKLLARWDTVKDGKRLHCVSVLYDLPESLEGFDFTDYLKYHRQGAIKQFMDMD